MVVGESFLEYTGRGEFYQFVKREQYEKENNIRKCGSGGTK